MSLNAKFLAIDLGTSESRILSYSSGLLATIPSTILISKKTGKPILTNKSLSAVLPNDYYTISPLREGRISNLDAVEIICRTLVEKVSNPLHRILPPRVCIGIATCSTPIEKEGVIGCSSAIGVSSITLIPQTLAAGVGAGLNLGEVDSGLILQLGAGVSEIAIISLGTISKTSVISFKSSELEGQLSRMLLLKLGAYVPNEAILHIIKTINMSSSDDDILAEIAIADTKKTDLRSKIAIRSGLVREIIMVSIRELAKEINEFVVDLDPETTQHFIDKGVILTGGLARLKGLSPVLSSLLELPVSVSLDPEDAVINGLREILHFIDINNINTNIIENIMGLN